MMRFVAALSSSPGFSFEEFSVQSPLPQRETRFRMSDAEYFTACSLCGLLDWWLDALVCCGVALASLVIVLSVVPKTLENVMVEAARQDDSATETEELKADVDLRLCGLKVVRLLLLGEGASATLVQFPILSLLQLSALPRSASLMMERGTRCARTTAGTSPPRRRRCGRQRRRSGRCGSRPPWCAPSPRSRPCRTSTSG